MTEPDNNNGYYESLAEAMNCIQPDLTAVEADLNSQLILDE